MNRPAEVNWKSVVVAVVLLVLSILGLTAVYRSKEYYCSLQGYAVMFDGGSSHTSMAIYQWLDETLEELGTGVVSQLAFAKRCGELGISSYADDPAELVPGLEECLHGAELVLPEFTHADTPVFLGATAGMRLLNATDPMKSDAVLETIRETFAATSFEYKDERQVTILPGEREGVSSWISSNYLEGNLGVEPATDDVIDQFTPSNPIPLKPTYGALDLGGASTQITFIPESPSEIPEQYRSSFRLYGNDYTAYTHSFLCYGADEALRRLQANLVSDSNFAKETVNPCAPQGYDYQLTGEFLWKAPCSTGPQALAGWGSEVTVAPGLTESMGDVTFWFNGTGDADACNKATKKLFNFDAKCENPPCSFNGVYTPLPFGSFKALSNYAYTSYGLSIDTSTPTIKEFMNATEDYCRKTYDELKVLPDEMEFKVQYCFRGELIGILLLDAFKFKDDTKNVEFTLEVNGIDLGWALGFITNATNRIPVETSCIGLSPPYLVTLLTIFLVIALIALLILVQNCLLKNRDYGKGVVKKRYVNFL